MALHLVLLPTILACALTINEQCLWLPTATNTTSVATPNPCPHSGYTPHPDFNCYKAFPSEHKSWSEARATCMEDGADLLVIETERERKEVYLPLWNSVDFYGYWPWVGVHIPQGGNDWTTVKSQPALSTWWKPREPDENAARKCAQADDTGLLLNNDCTYSFPFICEISL